MCAACVAQGAAYLVPAYAVVKTTRWRRRHRSPETTLDIAERGREPAVSAGPQG
jgi:hypothetical protein